MNEAIQLKVDEHDKEIKQHIHAIVKTVTNNIVAAAVHQQLDAMKGEIHKLVRETVALKVAQSVDTRIIDDAHWAELLKSYVASTMLQTAIAERLANAIITVNVDAK